MSNPYLNKIDDVIHAKARLGIMSLLMAHGACDFTFLKKKLGLSDGNLGTHIRKLEEAEYIQVEKTFEKRKPKTLCRPTKHGKKAYEAYIHALEEMIHIPKEEDDIES